MKILNMSVLSGVSLVALLTVQNVFAENKTDAQYWKETGFNTAVLSQIGMFTTPNCTAKLVNLEGCVAALNTLLADSSPPVILVPTAMIGQPPLQNAKPIRALPPFSLVAPPVIAKVNSRIAAHEAALKMLNLQNQLLQNSLNDGSAQKADFTAIYQQLIPLGVTDKNKDGLIASEVFNSYVTTALDAHSHINPVAEIEDMSNHSGNDFVGIGAALNELNGRVVIKATLKGSPSQRAGLKANDVLIDIDGVATTGISLDKVIDLIRGPAGSTEKVHVQRGTADLTISVVREKILQPNVSSELRENFGVKTGYIKLVNFMDRNACSSIAGAVKDLQSQNAQSLILDLRDNGGGLLDQAVCIGGLFSGKKTIVIEKSLTTNQSKSDVSDQDAITGLPLAVLINAGSASASEVLAGALQDYQRAWIIGDRSFGKASVQAPTNFFGDDDIYYFRTIERFYQPTGRTNERVGIIPDLSVPIKPNATADEMFALREADLFPIALSAAGPTWTQPRPQSAAKLSSCANDDGQAIKKYNDLIADSEDADYQALVAEKALGCKIN